MRIVAGQHRGRILESPSTDLIRPTSDKVRLALFNALNSRGAVVEAVVLDAFCGTGALGLEALSQGAAQAVFIDREKSSLDLARKNAALLKVTNDCVFMLKDSAKLSMRPDHQAKASLCFLDPPYRKDLIPQALASLRENDWLEDECWIVAEMEKEYSPPDFKIESEKIYGETKILIGRV